MLCGTDEVARQACVGSILPQFSPQMGLQPHSSVSAGGDGEGHEPPFVVRMSETLPPPIVEQLTRPGSVEAAVAAMKLFIEKGDKEKFQNAVAIYCIGACDRKERVETVLGALCCLAADVEGPRTDGLQMRPTEMHSLIFAGIMRAFYGNAAVDRATGARAQRKADAPQHVVNRSWPKPPAE